MDLNYLLARHQMALYHAQNASNDEARRAHQTMADTYAERITDAKCSTSALRLG